jgi:isopentenyl-diphosphate Delta-isomerase
LADQESVVLVDKTGHDLLNSDGSVRTLEKLEAHKQGTLHRAVSVFVFNKDNHLLLQKRALNKYHSPDKWSNTCCTHPFPGESPHAAASRRLKEEMGLECILTEAFTFLYSAELDHSLTENEFDHIFLGFSNENPVSDPNEVSEWKWISLQELSQEISNRPEIFSVWLRYMYPKLKEYYAALKTKYR